MQTTPHETLKELAARENDYRFAALSKAGLIENTDDETGLVFPLPINATIVRIVRGYDTRVTTRTKVRCAACRQHQPHNRGFRVAIEGGAEARIGFNCGEDHFGIGTWRSAVAEYDRRAENAQYLARIKPALDLIEQTIPLLQEWHVRTNRFGRWISNYRKELPQIFRRLAQVAKLNDGRLERQRKKKLTRVNRLGQTEQYSGTETIEIARIPFPGMFLGATPNTGLNVAKQEFGLAVALLENKRDNESLARAFSHIQRARQSLNEAGEVHRRILLNLSSGWLPSLCEWANQDEQLEATYEADGNTLIHDEGGITESFEFIDVNALGSASTAKISALWGSEIR